MGQLCKHESSLIGERPVHNSLAKAIGALGPRKKSRIPLILLIWFRFLINGSFYSDLCWWIPHTPDSMCVCAVLHKSPNKCLSVCSVHVLKQSPLKSTQIVHTCTSVSFQLSSWSIGIDGSHSDIIGSVWIQVLQDHVVYVPWYCSLWDVRHATWRIRVNTRTNQEHIFRGKFVFITHINKS